MELEILIAVLSLVLVLGLIGCLCYKHENKIHNIQIFAERNTGSNYLEKLFKMNFPNVKISWEDGWKHWQFSKIFTDPNYKGRNDTLYVLIVRDPYTWVRSMKRKPYHIKNPEDNISNFIRQRQHTVSDDHIVIKEPEYENIIEMRNTKNKGFDLIHNKVKNSIYIKYEDLSANPTETLKKFKNYLKVPKELNITNNVISSNQNNIEKKYTKPKFEKLSPEDVNFINNNLNWKLEKYSLTKNPE